MARSKRRFSFHPRVENLESRLQPGSVIMGQGYGWSLLVDNLSILNRDVSDSRPLISQASSENRGPAPRSSALDVQSDHRDIAVAGMAAGRSVTSSPPSNTLVDNLPAHLTTDDLGLSSVAGPRKAVPLPALPNAIAHQPTPTPAPAGFVESPIGVATPAQAAVGTANGTLASQPSLGAAPSRMGRADAQSPQASPAPALQSIPMTASTGIAPLLRPLSNLHVTVNHESVGGIHTFASQPVWATYLGGPGDDRILGAALSPVQGAAQPVLVTGFTQSASDPTEYDGLLAAFSTDGTSATVVTLVSGTGTRTEGHGIDVDSAGNVYVIGQTGQTSDPTTNTDWIARFDPTGTMTWATSFTPSGSTGVGNALKLDATGTNLYLTGGINDSLLVAELTNLSSTMPTIVYANTFSSTVGPAVGTAIAPDSTGNADLGFTLTTSGTTDNQPAIGQVAPDGSLPHSATFQSIGPKSGTFGLTVDAADNFYITGGVLDPTTSPAEVLLVAKFDGNFGQVYGWTYGFTNAGNGAPVDVVGRAIQVNDAGDAFMAVVRDGGTIGSGGSGVFMKLFEVNPGGGNSLDNQQFAHGTGEDQNRALVLDKANSVLYMAGFTASTDFNLTAGSFQPTYGGGPYDGVLIQEQLF